MNDDLILYSETDDYLSFFFKQHCHFFDYINNNIEEVYHYTSNETIEKILETSSLRFTNINELNDECEFTHLFTILYDRIPYYKLKYNEEFCNNLLEVCSKYCNEVYYYIGENLKNDIERNYYVMSFSLEDDNLSLWTLYTKEKNFIGCNFGINVEGFKCIQYINGPIWGGAVIYSEDEQIKILDELIASWYHYYEKASYLEYFNGDIHDALYKYALFFKHPAFEHEKEYRYIYYPADSNGIQEYNNKSFIDIQFNLKESISKVKLSPTLREEVYLKQIEKLFKKYNSKTEIFEISDIPFRV